MGKERTSNRGDVRKRAPGLLNKSRCVLARPPDAVTVSAAAERRVLSLPNSAFSSAADLLGHSDLSSGQRPTVREIYVKKMGESPGYGYLL